MKFNREKFFKSSREQFGKLTQTQTEGLNRLLAGYETYYGWWDSIPQIANSLAQIKWETAHSFHPVVEGYYLGDRNAANFYTGNTDYVRRFQRSLRYYPHFGRGDIQLTWRENYEEQDAYLRQYFPEVVADFERRTGAQFNLILHPEQVLDGWISFCVMTVGMHKGTFREGQTLDRYINPARRDHYGARNIVNGDAGKKIDGAKIGDHIAAIAGKFEKILEYSLEKKSSDVPELTADNSDAAFDRLTASGRDQTVSADDDDSLPADSDLLTTAGSLPRNPIDSATDSEPSPDPNVVAEIKKTEERTDRDGGKQTLEEKLKTLPGDAPETAPRSWFNVEDWKPWVFGKLKLTVKSLGGFNLTQGTAAAAAAWKSGEYWYVPLVISGLLLVLSLAVCAAVAVVLLLIWYFNRKEIAAYKTRELEARHDPNLYNFGLKFQRIGEEAVSRINSITGGKS